jgi:hypothetical protein
MHDAIYYPTIRCTDRGLIASALFLWDSLSFIVPHKGMAGSTGDEEVDEALELVGRELVPSGEAKREATSEIRYLIETARDGDIDLTLSNPESLRTYPIYPDKFELELWDELVAAGATAFDADENNFLVRDTLGLYMMSMLATTCGAGRKRLVTDRVAGYESLYRSLADISPGRDGTPDSGPTPLLTVALRGFNFDSIPLGRLIALRRDESELQRSMRTTYLDAVDRCIGEISTHASRPDVIEEIVQGFTADMERDLKELKRYLKREAGQMILSKEFGVAVLATAWSGVDPISGGILSAGALGRGLLQYQDRRRKLLQSHASAWLYETRHGVKLY